MSKHSSAGAASDTLVRPAHLTRRKGRVYPAGGGELTFGYHAAAQTSETTNSQIRQVPGIAPRRQGAGQASETKGAV